VWWWVVVDGVGGLESKLSNQLWLSFSLALAKLNNYDLIRHFIELFIFTLSIIFARDIYKGRRNTGPVYAFLYNVPAFPFWLLRTQLMCPLCNSGIYIYIQTENINYNNLTVASK
jgi:hypothetical protein